MYLPPLSLYFFHLFLIVKALWVLKINKFMCSWINIRALIITFCPILCVLHLPINFILKRYVNFIMQSLTDQKR